MGGREVVRNGPICVLFEHMITLNAARGYRLLTFQLASTFIGAADSNSGETELNETIIAVFERVGNA